MSIEFFITVFVIVATPGTGALFTIAAGISRGVRASFVAAVGCTLGIVPHLVAALTGLAALLNASAVAFQTLKYLGVAYLLYLAWKIFRDKSAFTVQESSEPVSDLKVIGQAILINVLNPKLTIFFFAFLPQFVHSDQADALPMMILLSGIFMAATLIIFAMYGIFAGLMRAKVLSRPRVVAWMRRSFAASYVILAGRLALTEK